MNHHHSTNQNVYFDLNSILNDSLTYFEKLAALPSKNGRGGGVRSTLLHLLANRASNAIPSKIDLLLHPWHHCECLLTGVSGSLWQSHSNSNVHLRMPMIFNKICTNWRFIGQISSTCLHWLFNIIKSLTLKLIGPSKSNQIWKWRFLPEGPPSFPRWRRVLRTTWPNSTADDTLSGRNMAAGLNWKTSLSPIPKKASPNHVPTDGHNPAGPRTEQTRWNDSAACNMF